MTEIVYIIALLFAGAIILLWKPAKKQTESPKNKAHRMLDELIKRKKW